MEVPVKKNVGPGQVEPAAEKEAYTPAVDILETPKNVVLFADLPGVPKEALSVTLDQGTLTIRGKGKVELPPNAELRYREVEFGDFSRSFRLGPEVSGEGMEAVFEDGVLRVVFPKSDWASTKKIEVK
jgi:HSP20 family protein